MAKKIDFILGIMLLSIAFTFIVFGIYTCFKNL
jgi:hypothetical protein